MAEEEQQPVKKKGRFAINWAKSGGYILGMALAYFFLFGFICNSGGSLRQQDPGNKLLFVYTAFFNTDLLTFNSLSIPGIISWIELIPLWTSIFIVIIIGFLQAYREDFLVMAVKKNLMMVPFVVALSWFWFSFSYEIAIWTVILQYFSYIHGYLNIIFLFFIYGGTGLLGGAWKINRYRRSHRFDDTPQEAIRV